MPKNKSHHAHTKGNWFGHLCRRLIHISILVVPLIFYTYEFDIVEFLHISIRAFLYILLAIVVVSELIRIKFGIVLFAQRDYEAKQVSALAWGAVSIILVLLYAGGPQFGVPLIWSLALGDPFLGELRRFINKPWLIQGLGVLLVLVIWWGCGFYFSISLWWGVILAPITVAVESIKVSWIDDNALMLLIPLFIIMIGSLLVY